MEKAEVAIEDWDASVHLFIEAVGSAPPEDRRQLALIQLLPVDVRLRHNAHGVAGIPNQRRSKEVCV